MPTFAAIPAIRRLSPTLLLLLTLLCGTLPRVHASPTRLTPATTTLAFPLPPVIASAAALYDADANRWLYLANADQPLSMASTTKIMTAILTIEHGNLDQRVYVSRKAATIGQTTMGLVQGERVRVLDLLYGLLLPSGNDAAIALAEYVAGSVPAFVEMMNARATALGLLHTHYDNPYGFFSTPSGDSDDHYTTARDLVVLAQYALRFPVFRQIVSTRSYTVPATPANRRHSFSNINNVLYWYPGADGVKPGWTSGAGICQVVDVHRFGRHLIAAVLHTANLYTDVRDLLNWGFGDFTWVQSTVPSDRPDQYIASGAGALAARFYPYTGHSVQGSFLRYFMRHGGLAVLGFPRTEVLPFEGGMEQFFTNQVLRLDPQSGMVGALPLGLAAVPDPAMLARLTFESDTSWRTYYPQTGHTVTYRFRSWYLQEGGPATFGYPVTEKVQQNGQIVQYFEKSVFTWHPTAHGGYVVMAPLGQERLNQLGLLPAPGTLAQSPYAGGTL